MTEKRSLQGPADGSASPLFQLIANLDLNPDVEATTPASDPLRPLLTSMRTACECRCFCNVVGHGPKFASTETAASQLSR
jgi:hypothetical protein